jgi:hypothetical protein
MAYILLCILILLFLGAIALFATFLIFAIIKKPRKKIAKALVIDASSFVLLFIVSVIMLTIHLINEPVEDVISNTSTSLHTEESIESISIPAPFSTEEPIESTSPLTPQSEENQEVSYEMYETPFVCEGFEVTFHTNLEFSAIDSSSSEYDGSKIVRIPFTVKNLREEAAVFEYVVRSSYDIFGNEIEDLSILDSGIDGVFDLFQSLEPGESQDRYISLEYSGDGIYLIEIGHLDDSRIAMLPISMELPSIFPLTFEETVLVEGFEITFHQDITFAVIDNKYSENHGKTVARVPVTIKNVWSKADGLSMLYYTIYGSNGVQLDRVHYYFDDGDNLHANLRLGAQMEAAFYLLYDGDGDYYVSFDFAWGDPIEVVLPISK